MHVTDGGGEPIVHIPNDTGALCDTGRCKQSLSMKSVALRKHCWPGAESKVRTYICMLVKKRISAASNMIISQL